MTSAPTNPHATLPANPASGELRVASLFDRVIAVVIDFVLQLLLIPFAVFVIRFLDQIPWISNLTTNLTNERPLLFLFISWFVVAAPYSVWFHGRRGVTPGKRALSIRVTRPDGRGLGYPRAALRFLVATMSWLLGSVPFWMAVFNRQRQTLPDYLGGSIVVRTGLPVVDAGQPSRFDYAGFWIRAAAIVIDGFVFVILACWIALIGFWLEELAGVKMVAGYLLLPAGLLYNTILVANWSATPGKMVFDLAVVRATGERVGFGRACSRHLAFWAIPAVAMHLPIDKDLWLGSLLMFGPLLIWPLFAAFDRQKRALHDRICGTRVIYLR